MAGLGGLLPVAVTVIVTTIASDTSHPNTYAAPFNAPRLDGRMTMNAVSGNGSKVTAKPISMRFRTMAIPPVSPGLSRSAPDYSRGRTAGAVCTNMSSTAVGGASDTEAPFRG